MQTVKKLMFSLSLIMLFQAAFSQRQTVKGRITDARADFPIIGASVVVLDSDPIKGGVTDLDGYFSIRDVPVGRQTLGVQYIGYKSMTLPNVLVTAGKEVVLNIALEESVEQLNEVVVTADADKDLPLNDFAKVSARTFSLEEVTRFSGGRNDVARLATSFAGASAPNDSRNDIVVRGNSPTGLLWRIEGIPVANTNHFSTLGTTGGPVSALNTNLLRTSDFLTGAFPAEYGNANGAVFDINFRNGNKDNYEFTAQMAAFSGLEFMAEGPFRRSKNGSFVISYRYGIASLAATGTSATPFFQDIGFKVNFGNSKWGTWQLFGFGGLSHIDFLGDEIDEDDLFANPNEDAFVESQTGLVGLTNTLRLNKTTFLRTTLGASTNFNEYRQDNLIRDETGRSINKYRATNVENRESRLTISSVLNKKFNARRSLRAGIINELYIADLFTRDRDNRSTIPDADSDGVPDYFIDRGNLDESYHLSQVFAQVENKVTDELSVTAGIHAQYHDYTSDFMLSPRAALSWQMKPGQRWNLAYGMHGQAIPSPILFFDEETAPGVTEKTNRQLKFMKSHHAVLGYDRNLGTDWRLKAEVYYQWLFDVPIQRNSGSYSVINEGADFDFEEQGSLVNEGTGTNYGLEITLEKFFSRGYYLLMTTSLFESTYEGSDGVARSTAFNNNYVYNALFGKEWKFGTNGKNAWTFDTKLTTSGGQPFTPVDLVATRNNAGREVRSADEAFGERYDSYFRWDVKFGVRINSRKKNVSHQFFIDLQNVTNRTNEFIRRYNEVTDEINRVDQNGFFPDVMYRIQF